MKMLKFINYNDKKPIYIAFKVLILLMLNIVFSILICLLFSKLLLFKIINNISSKRKFKHTENKIFYINNNNYNCIANSTIGNCVSIS